tara:strand:- start:6358 stop:6609 length:252 start_codon:yes stop_codon:yes gene_type:complete
MTQPLVVFVVSSVPLYVSVNFLFYSAKCVVYLPMVFFVVAADFANECHQYSETTTDASNHNLSIHGIIRGVLVVLAVPLYVPK